MFKNAHRDLTKLAVWFKSCWIFGGLESRNLAVDGVSIVLKFSFVESLTIGFVELF